MKTAASMYESQERELLTLTRCPLGFKNPEEITNEDRWVFASRLMVPLDEQPKSED